MKKLLAFTFAMLAVLAFAAAPGYACDKENSTASTSQTDGKLANWSKSCSSSKTNAKLASSTSGTDGKLANSGKTCSYSKTKATKASASTVNSAGCSAHSLASLSESASLIQSRHDAHCKIDGGCQLVNIAVSGMTCGGCESGVKSALAKVDGVNAVLSIDYKEGIAQVCTKSGTDNALLTKAVATSGFESQIIPAVVKTSYKDGKTSLTGYDSKNCSAACKLKAKNAKASSDKVEAKVVTSTNTRGDTY